ncbi:hypothetical protein [Actinacidiphila soli]|uniref:hypothetical protein n=1 Tax=Actinacidiphila soli TaxID=2487275 RepID=UPI00389917CB
MTTQLAPPPVEHDSGRRSHRAAPPSGGGLAVRAKRLFTGRPDDPRWARPALWAILLLATALYAWNLTTISGNSFYNAAVYSGTKSWKAFFFGSPDAGNWSTVDKPPFALWMMGISARTFGYGTWQLMLPLVGVEKGVDPLIGRGVGQLKNEHPARPASQASSTTTRVPWLPRRAVCGVPAGRT